MRERRKHKSIWNMEQETDHLSGMKRLENEYLSSHGNKKRHQEFSASRNSPGFASTDHWHSIEDRNYSASISENYMGSRHEIFEGKERNGGKKYNKIFSPPKVDEVEPRNYYQTHGYNHDRRRAQRYPVSGRSRSRSRSSSRNRGNASDRLRGDSPTRARSRSRGNTWDCLKGDSPIRDQRHSSHTWSGKRSSHDKSSQACRNFALGKCNRGSQCWFSHSNDRINRRDGDYMEDDAAAAAETWRHRADHGRLNRQAYDGSSGLISRDDDLLSESYRSRSSRSDVPCKDFARGKCRWGDSCRFSHHVEYDEFSRGNKNENFDKGKERQSWRSHHKSFSSAMSGWENSKCSREEQSLNDRGGFLNDDKRSTRDLRKWDGPTWDDVDKASEPARIRGWGETTLTNLNVTDESNIGETDDDKWGHTLCNETEVWEIPDSKDRTLNVEKQPHSRSNEPFSGNDLAIGEQLLVDSSQSQNQKVPVNAYEYNPFQGSHSISEVLHQPRRLVINLTNPTSKVDLSEHYLNQSWGNMSSEPCSILNGTYMEQNSLSFNISNSGVITQQNLPLDLQSQKVDRLSGTLEPEPPQILTDSLPCESHAARVTKYSLTSADQVETLSSMEKIHNYTDTSRSTTLLNTDTSQRYSISIPPSLDLSSSMRNVTGNIEQSDRSTQLDLELNSPTPLVHESPKLRQDDKCIVANSEVAKDNRVIGKEIMVIEENKDTENQEGRGKNEEGCITDKDDKGMRMFKNALIQFVKDILKPMWKEGRMSRDVHKTVVKKVVDKVSSSIPAEHVPKAQDKIEHYLSFSKSKITKLVQAYVERCHKAETTGVTK